MVINNQHEHYINNDVLIKFIRENEIKVPDCKYNTENMIQIINEYAVSSTQNKIKVEQAINEWLAQGRKKILYRYFEEELNFGENVNIIKENITGRFELTDETDLAKLKVPDNNRELWKIDFVTENDDVVKVKFLYIEKLNKKTKEEEYIEIALPIIVVLDIVAKEIYAKVASKSDLYRDTENKVEDIKVGQEVLEEVITILGLSSRISSTQKSELQSILFAIHKEITELPEEIINTADSINDEIMEFIGKVTEKIEMLDNELNVDEMFNGVKNVILKNIIGMYDDIRIFEEGKYAISTGIDGSGATMSKFRFNAPAREPVQSKPEYQDVRSIMGDLEKIRKDVLFWNSVRNNIDKIRMKMYAHNIGYIQICFEQYVYGEDIENVLSKIREFKERR
ncbi:hypothetical protein EXM65_06595 [Clostridium botulinum]|uniref:Uncharacterized protein n=1 Tax=Clostridium botulinum TaxID=1491 RepID=A0A6M0SR28_CLOBO|nr:hypothetical protein [Clostridium botulinum]